MSTEEAGGSNAQSVLVGVLVPLGVVILVVIAIIVALIIYFCYSQYKLKDSLKVCGVVDAHQKSLVFKFTQKLKFEKSCIRLSLYKRCLKVCAEIIDT